MNKRTISYALIAITVFVLVAYSGGVIQDLTNVITGNIIKNNIPTIIGIYPIDNSVVHSNSIEFKWSYKDEDGDKQQKYIVHVDESRSFYSPDIISDLNDASSVRYYIPSAQKGKKLYWRVIVHDGNDWSKWSTIKYFTFFEANKCEDNTDYGSCSINKPEYCNRLGNLLDDCNTCGCNQGEICNTDGTCTIPKCEDNTKLNECSNNKPLFCTTKGLIERCDLCGCDDGTCDSFNQCILEKNVEEPTKKGILIVIWEWISGLF